MHDMTNEQYIKLMWAGDDHKVLWDMKNESEISISKTDIATSLKERLIQWSSLYSDLYDRWLDTNAADGLFDINSNFNKEGIQLVKELNEIIPNIHWYYWFDIHEELREKNFKWMRCPVCDTTLTNMKFPPKNELVCNECKIVVPSY